MICANVVISHHFDDDKLEWIPVPQQVQKPVEAPKSEPTVLQKKPDEAKKDVEAAKQDNTGKDTKNTLPVSEQPAKEEKQRVPNPSVRFPAQRHADNKIFTAAEREQQSVRAAEEIPKANELEAAQAKKIAEER